MTLKTKLEQARRHVFEGKRIVAKQRSLIAKKRAGGLDTSTAEKLLIQFERSLAIFEADLLAIEKAKNSN